MVELFDETSGAPQLRDVLGEGDLLGRVRFLNGGAYLSSARTACDVIIYALAQVFLRLLSAAPKAGRSIPIQPLNPPFAGGGADIAEL